MAIAQRRPFVLILSLLILLSGMSWAGTGGVVSLPQGNKRPKNKLRVNLDFRWVEANGYHPVQVELVNTPLGPAKADRNFRIVLRPNSYYGVDSHGVTAYAELPQGARTATTSVSVPQRGAWGSIQVAVYEDGRFLKDLSDNIGVPSRGYYEWSEALPAVLIIDSDAPDMDARLRLIQQSQFRRNRELQPRKLPEIRGLGAYFPPPENNNLGDILQLGDEIDDADTLRILSYLPRYEILPPGQLPDKWIDYTCFDICFISQEDLVELAAVSPDACEALLDWTRAGQTLCVYSVDFAELAQLEKLLKISPLPSLSESTEASRGWTSHKLTDNREIRIKGMETLNNSRPNRNEMIRELNRRAEQNDKKDKSGLAFFSRPMGLGRVFAMETDEPFMSESFPMPQLFNEIGRENWMWYQRHGFSLYRDNDSFWNFMIPGVGKAPVNSYLVLITLFVIVIGPVNYVLLRRRKRLYLLLVTVPAGAGLVTFALMNYALISDGLGVRVRVRSFTHLDQANKEAASWSRQSYYAGLAPSQGLTFPANTAFYAIHQFPSDRRANRSDRMLVWNEDQNLASGYLKSRSTSQFMVVTAGESQHELVVTESPDSLCRVENQLGTDIQRLYLCDRQGNFLQARDIAAGGNAQLTPTDIGQVVAAYKSVLSENQPQFPVGYDAQYYQNSFGFGRNYYYDYYSGWNNVDSSLPAPLFQIGILERNLARAVGSASKVELKPRSYIAVVDSSPIVPIGYSRAREEASLHVISGHW